MEYRVQIEITNTTDAEALTALEYLKDTYGPTIQQAVFRSTSKIITALLLQADFTSSVQLIQSLKNEFSTRLTKYDLQVNTV